MTLIFCCLFFLIIENGNSQLALNLENYFSILCFSKNTALITTRFNKVEVNLLSLNLRYDRSNKTSSNRRCVHQKLFVL